MDELAVLSFRSLGASSRPECPLARIELLSSLKTVTWGISVSSNKGMTACHSSVACTFNAFCYRVNMTYLLETALRSLKGLCITVHLPKNERFLNFLRVEIE